MTKVCVEQPIDLPGSAYNGGRRWGEEMNGLLMHIKLLIAFKCPTYDQPSGVIGFNLQTNVLKYMKSPFYRNCFLYHFTKKVSIFFVHVLFVVLQIIHL